MTALNYYLKNIEEILGIVPIYSLKDGITQSYLRKIIEITYDKVNDQLVDLIPNKYLENHHLISYKDAIYNIHFPTDKTMLSKSLSRLKYEEFLRFYISLSIINGSNNKPFKEKKIFDINKINELINSYPFDLTEGRKESIKEILNDISSTKLMYRLLQGDVGCGKTKVAIVALFANYLAGYQGTIMAPTEILAKQHFKEISNDLSKFGVKVALLCSDTVNSKEIKNDILLGNYDVIVGTHALFSDDVSFENLGLVITDEQHRFGVKQRRRLKEKGDKVDFLMMSATPIPRTLASSIFGDMDISTIESMPINRKGSKTYLLHKNSIAEKIDDLKETLNRGQQIYIIASAIEESDSYKAKDVLKLYNSLEKALYPYKLGLLHGKLTSSSKDEVMNAFNQNKIQVLVSTTVVEVGVNVPNATMMIVYDADRFGLSQLHQLRGRIQRGPIEGTCYLLTDSKEENTIKRLEVLCNTNDGFKIAYEDLKQRGPGDILGVRQSGLPSFILGNFIEDQKFIHAANEDAKEISNNLDIEENRKYWEIIKSNIQKMSID